MLLQILCEIIFYIFKKYMEIVQSLKNKQLKTNLYSIVQYMYRYTKKSPCMLFVKAS